MPGIYVRKASWIDWTQKEENPALTVPGSYWLCHKKNIYKFIFRYHRTIRNIKQFHFGRELMKVIRRIIKNQPPAGQQFGTSHLLVTFNRVSWTRQDKIFALMKFRDRSVVTFSHAFMLTIKLFHTEIEQNSKCTTPPSSDHSSIHQDENLNGAYAYESKNGKGSKKYLIHSPKDNFSDKSNQCDNIRKQALESDNEGTQLNNSSLTSNLKKLSVDKKSIKQLTDSEDTSKLNKNLNASFEVSITSENNIKLNDEIKESNINNLQEGNIEHQLSPKKDNIKNNCDVSNDEKKLSEHTKKDSVEVKDNLVLNNSKMLNNNSTVDDTNADSANLPYQYLIEKEIENAKVKVRKRKLEEIDEKDLLNDVEEDSDEKNIQDSPCSKKRKYALDNVQRSSDITDLVMEGLMFTIRQGQGAVAVIEQKTKFEVDEVLENSEKIETEEGEKRLRNSSLLGLENLITMIELPKENKPGNKCQDVINQESTLRNKSINEHLFNDTKYPSINNNIKEQNIALELKHIQRQPSCNNSILATTSFSNDNGISSIISKHDYSEIYDNYKCKENTKFVQNKDTEYEKEVEEEYEEEEEDIIPEALQNEIFQPSTLSLKTDESNEKFIPNKDLLMDDVDNEELIKFEKNKNEFNPSFNKNLQPTKYLKNNCSNDNEISMNSVMNETQELYNNTIYEAKSNNTKKCKPNTPVVISSKLITLNEIPLPLQKILKNKLSIKQTSLNNDSKINKDNIEIHKIQSCPNEDNASNKQLESQIINGNDVTNTQCLEHHQPSIHDKKEIDDENKSSAALKIEVKDPSVSDKNIMLKEEESQGQNSCTDKVEKLPPHKIKDITEEFYKDLSYLQKKRNLINRKYLRSRRKSLNMLNDTNTGEMHIQMVKFFQDITRGAKVVVRRINVNKYS